MHLYVEERSTTWTTIWEDANWMETCSVRCSLQGSRVRVGHQNAAALFLWKRSEKTRLTFISVSGRSGPRGFRQIKTNAGFGLHFLLRLRQLMNDIALLCCICFATEIPWLKWARESPCCGSALGRRCLATASLANTSSLPSICRPNLIIWLNSDRARATQFSVRDHRFLNLQTIVCSIRSALRCRKHKSKIKEESVCTKISPISYWHLLITVNAN